MGIEVFNRYENKFLIDQDTYEALTNRISEYMELDAFNKKNGFYTICNIYYDTPNDDLIRKSLSKPVYKEKLRLRAYGVPGIETKGYLEIKKKYKGLVNKRRTSMTLFEAYNFVESGIMPNEKSYHNKQVLKELHYFINRYELKPAVYIAYDRKAYFEGELRITFDTNVRTRRYDLALELGDYGEQLLEPGQWLMEVKVDKAYPLWLTHLLAEYKVYPTSFSKYGREFAKYSQQKEHSKGDIFTCLNPYLVPQQQQVPQLLFQ